MEAAADYQRLFLWQSGNGCYFFARNMDRAMKNLVSSFFGKSKPSIYQAAWRQKER